jgi:RNA polymerase sigma-70 factor (ECF subfamily)
VSTACGVVEMRGVLAGASRLDRSKAERFREAALPHLDDVYTLARYLLRNAADAEDAAQECYLRAYRHFDTFRGGPIKPWLCAILRNVCRAEFARRKDAPEPPPDDRDSDQDQEPLWQEAPASPETATLERLDAQSIARLVAALPEPFRETLVLREISELSYREIADLAGVPIGTVMSRLARARLLLREAWNAESKGPSS